MSLILRKFFSLLLALYILNFSIDSPDSAPDHIAEDLSLNDIESFYEFFLEDIIGIENAVEEHDERDHEDGGALDFSKIFMTSQKTYLFTGLCQNSRPAYPFTAASASIASYFDLDGPPPKG